EPHLFRGGHRGRSALRRARHAGADCVARWANRADAGHRAEAHGHTRQRALARTRAGCAFGCHPAPARVQCRSDRCIEEKRSARMPDILIQEIGPRDGLQIEPAWVPTPRKIALLDALSTLGFSRIEVSSFV